VLEKKKIPVLVQIPFLWIPCIIIDHRELFVVLNMPIPILSGAIKEQKSNSKVWKPEESKFSTYFQNVSTYNYTIKNFVNKLPTTSRI